MAMYRHTFTVFTRVARFPVDMLRYDSVAPLDGDAVRVIETAEYGDLKQLQKNDDGFIEARLVRIASRNWRPTEGRWNSFGWYVKPESLERNKVE